MPSSHPSLGLSVFFLSFFLSFFHDARSNTGTPVHEEEFHSATLLTGHAARARDGWRAVAYRPRTLAENLTESLRPTGDKVQRNDDGSFPHTIRPTSILLSCAGHQQEGELGLSPSELSLSQVSLTLSLLSLQQVSLHQPQPYTQTRIQNTTMLDNKRVAAQGAHGSSAGTAEREGCG